MRDTATTIIIFMLYLTFQSCNSMKEADIVFLNGRIITADSKFSIQEAVAVSGDRITATGSNREISKFSGPGTLIIDLKGKCVIPGLIDAHLHPESASLSELGESLPDIRNLNQLLGWIRKEAAVKGKGIWIILPKFFPTRLTEMRQPYIEELDKAAPDNPVFLNGSFGGMINTAALKASSIDQNIQRQDLLRDPVTGKLTGFIRSSAFFLLKTPPEKQYTEQEKESALTAMLKRYNAFGFTSLWSGTGDQKSIKMYRSLAVRKMLTARICQNILFPLHGHITAGAVDSVMKNYKIRTGDGDEWVRVGSLKVFIDGGILTGTAWMEEPWGTKASAIFGIRDSMYRGALNFTKEELRIIVSAANSNGWNFTAHATGEGAIDMLLDVYRDVNSEKSIKGRHFSVIHGNFFNRNAIKEMADLGIGANLQPAWFFKDVEAMDSILGHSKTAIFHPYRKLADAGVLINGGSDHMVGWDANTSINPYNPFLAMYAMVTRKSDRGSVFHPEEALTREEAIKAYTINNARATSEESVKGSIEPGKLADMAVLSNDILSCPEDSIRNIRAVMTILGGSIVYRAE